MAAHTLTALRRWGCQDKPLPPVQDIKKIHVYDFDNTLFASPLPNRQLWKSDTCGHLQGQEFLHNGGWWHNPKILEATGEGIEVEERRGWEGCWNEKVVELSQLSMEDPMTLSVLLTGRSEQGFAELVGRMAASKGLEYDLVVLKPAVGPSGDAFTSTMKYKQAFLNDLVMTYAAADELKIYEDRIKHVKDFRDYFAAFNSQLMSAGPANPHIVPRPPIVTDVVEVSEQEKLMDPVREVEEVQRMINVHNQAVLDGSAPRGAVPYKMKRTVFYTGYLISQEDTDRLKSLVRMPSNVSQFDIKYLANNIMITPRPAAANILTKVGGIGAKMSWRVTAVANMENRVWAARVQPVNPLAKVYTENKMSPSVVLALKGKSKPYEANQISNWQPVTPAEAFEFETTVGEKVLLRVEEEDPDEDEHEASFPKKENSRKHPREEDFPPLGAPRGNNKQQAKPQQRGGGAWQNKPGGAGYAPQRGGGGGFGGNRGGRGGRGGGGNFGPRGRGGGGRARGPRGGYRSLDDNVGQGYGGGSMQY